MTALLDLLFVTGGLATVFAVSLVPLALLVPSVWPWVAINAVFAVVLGGGRKALSLLV